MEVEFEKTIQPKVQEDLLEEEAPKKTEILMRFANVVLLEEREVNLGTLIV